MRVVEQRHRAEMGSVMDRTQAMQRDKEEAMEQKY